MSQIIPMKLRDWIDQAKLDWESLSFNLSAIQLLEKNKNKIHWMVLSMNPNAIHLLEKDIDKDIDEKELNEDSVLKNTNIEILVDLTKFFNSDIGLLYQQNSRLKAIKLMLEHYKDNFEVMKKVKISLRDMKLKDDVNIDDVIKENDKIINEVAQQYIKDYDIDILGE